MPEKDTKKGMNEQEKKFLEQVNDKPFPIVQIES